jgi:Fur family ferric uptake transcriptional regulator
MHLAGPPRQIAPIDTIDDESTSHSQKTGFAASIRILLQLSYNKSAELNMPFPETETPGRLQAELMSRGLRMTRQRRTILQVVETAKQHLDASQLLRRARRIDPQIDRVTVYRTLGLLKRHGLIDELDLMHMQGEKHFYERRPQRDHIHMACLRCGKITEFESDLFDRLKGQIQRDCQFHIVVTRLEVGGYCAQCRTDSAS